MTTLFRVAKPARRPAPAPAPVSILRRKCACGGTPGPTGECAECRRRRERTLERRGTDPVAEEAPPIVREVLGAPGQALDPATRAFFEPRFGYDFSRVRVHADGRAAASARAVQAAAYTVGSDIAFAAGAYAPHTDAGRRLLAHELAHVQQQSNVGIPLAGLEVAPTDSPAEGEANRAADAVLRGAVESPTPQRRESQPALHRWKITGNSAVSDDDSDTLGRLANQAGARFNDWKCIRPIRMQTKESGHAPANFDARYELYVQTGDKFDISNLTETVGGSSRLYFFGDSSEAMNADLVKLFYPGSTSTLGADNDFEGAAGSGRTPIGRFRLFGHSAGDQMWGAASSFTPADFDPEEPVPSFALAEAGLFPRRCWFTRNASGRLIGCNSETVGQDFAAHYLRKGAEAITTTKSVRPKCSAALLDPATGACTAYDGVDFATSPSPSATSLDGPFWSASAFHGGKFWKTMKGKL